MSAPPEAPIRVLHVIAGLAPRHGGVAANVIGIARAARTVGIINIIFSLDACEPAAAHKHTRVTLDELAPLIRGVNVELFRTQRPYRFMYSPDLRRRLERRVDEYDLVHIHSLFLYPQLAAFRVARRAGKPYIVTVHGCLAPALRNRNRHAKWLVDHLWQRRMLDGAAVLHFTTEAERDLAADLGLSAPSVVVPNGIAFDAFQVGPQHRGFGLGSETRIVLYLGRLSHVKGLDVLLRAFAALRLELPDVRLVVAGPDDENLMPRLTTLAEELRIREDVVFTGHLAGEDRLSALAGADVFVLPSLTENFGTTVIEAMAAGVPVVISPQVNLADSVARAHAGIVCDRHPIALAGALRSVLCDPAEQERLRAAGRDFARAYDWSMIAPRLRSMYEAAIRGGEA